MVRYKLALEYDGGPFHGWQRLTGHPTVQGSLEDAVEKLCGVRNEVTGAGRTDSGVHATGQIAHVDLPEKYGDHVVRNALNAHLRPHPIAVLSAEETAPTFHARFDATARAYVYRIINRRGDLALERGRAFWISRAVDEAAMHVAAQRLLGKHDFTTFRDTNCQANSPIRTLDIATVAREGETVLVKFEARSFLHRQVRSMVGSLVQVGIGKIGANDVTDALAAADRARCGPVAPAHGLYLARVDYPATAGGAK